MTTASPARKPRRRVRVIVGAVVGLLIGGAVGVAGASTWVLLGPPTYAATAVGSVSTASGDGTAMNDAVAAARTETVADAVGARLSQHLSGTGVLDATQFEWGGDAPLLVITTRAETPAGAESLARAWTAELPDAVREGADLQYTSDVDALRATRVYPSIPLMLIAGGAIGAVLGAAVGASLAAIAGRSKRRTRTAVSGAPIAA